MPEAQLKVPGEVLLLSADGRKIASPSFLSFLAIEERVPCGVGG